MSLTVGVGTWGYHDPVQPPSRDRAIAHRIAPTEDRFGNCLFAHVFFIDRPTAILTGHFLAKHSSGEIRT